MSKDKATGYLVLQNGSDDVSIPLYGEWPKYAKDWLEGKEKAYCPNPFEI